MKVVQGKMCLATGVGSGRCLNCTFRSFVENRSERKSLFSRIRQDMLSSIQHR